VLGNIIQQLTKHLLEVYLLCTLHHHSEHVYHILWLHIIMTGCSK